MEEDYQKKIWGIAGGMVLGGGQEQFWDMLMERN